MNHVTPDTILQKLPPYQGKEVMRKAHQVTFDIISSIQRLHIKAAPQYDKICINFWQGNVPDTARYMYDWVRTHMPYHQEPTKTQTVKWPQAILEERFDYGSDCKHYASWLVGIGEALRRRGFPIKCFYRFASYNPRRRSPGHVFAVFVDQGREIWADPVPGIGGFDNRRVTPAFTTDKMPPMSSRHQSIGALYEISGLNAPPVATTRTVAGTLYAMPANQTVGRLHIHRHHWLDEMDPRNRIREARNFVRHHKPRMLPMPPGLNGYEIQGYEIQGMDDMGKAKKKHHGLRIKIKVPKIKIQPGKFLVKYGLATSRNAFLLLVKLNVFHLATKMWEKAAHDKNSANWKKLAHAWVKKGGKPEKLYGEIVRGVKTWNKLHHNKQVKVSGMEYMDGPGYDDMGYTDDSLGYYHDGMTIGDILAFVHNCHNRRMHRKIGVAHVAVAAGIIAAATPLLKALGGILKSFGVNTKQATDAGAADAEELASAHNKSADAGLDEGDTNPDGTETKVVKNADGSQSLHVKKIPGLADEDQGDQEEGDMDTKTKTKVKTKTKTVTTTGDEEEGGEGDTGKGLISNVTDFVKGHKVGVIATGVGLTLFILGVNRKVTRKHDNLKPIMVLTGLGGMAFGGYNLFAK